MEKRIFSIFLAPQGHTKVEKHNFSNFLAPQGQTKVEKHKILKILGKKNANLTKNMQKYINRGSLELPKGPLGGRRQGAACKLFRGG